MSQFSKGGIVPARKRKIQNFSNETIVIFPLISPQQIRRLMSKFMKQHGSYRFPGDKPLIHNGKKPR